MDSEELLETYFSPLKRHLLPVILGLVGLIFFIYGLIGLFAGQKSFSEAVMFEPGSSSKQLETASELVVDVEGAVVNPGVYKLPKDARIQEALIAAGGLSSRADRAWVSKSLNLASRLIDGAKIYIPVSGENVSVSTTVLGTQSSSSVSGLVGINSATEKELDTLPGIGPVTARKIIESRPYASINELLDKKIVGAKVFSQIKDKISIE